MYTFFTVSKISKIDIFMFLTILIPTPDNHMILHNCKKDSFDHLVVCKSS